MKQFTIFFVFFFCFFFLFCLFWGPELFASKLDFNGKIDIIRALSSEYVSTKIPLPVNDSGIVVNSGGEFDWEKNEQAILSTKQFLAPGTTARITRITFSDNRIVFELNGGGKKKKKRILEHIQIGAGGTTSPLPTQPSRAPQGSYVALIFEDQVPNLTPEEVKTILSGILDFSKKSALGTFLDSVPDEFRDAVKNKYAAVGMDKDLVLAAMGRPMRKIRETKDGVDQEDWVYGERPFKVTFVTFVEGRVVSVKEY